MLVENEKKITGLVLPSLRLPSIRMAILAAVIFAPPYLAARDKGVGIGGTVSFGGSVEQNSRYNITFVVAAGDLKKARASLKPYARNIIGSRRNGLDFTVEFLFGPEDLRPWWVVSLSGGKRPDDPNYDLFVGYK